MPHRDSGPEQEKILAQLRTSCKKGSANRPPEMDLRGMDFSGADLSGLDLSTYNCSGADFSGANLSDTNFSWANLVGARFCKARLDRCEMLGADLSQANLNECSGRQCGFGAVNLAGASMISANLQQISFSKSNLRKVDMRGATIELTNFSDADLSGATCIRARFRKNDFKYCNVKGAAFDLADLRGARLLSLKNYKKAGWIGSDIRDVDPRGAYGIVRYIKDENYLYEFKTQSKVHTAFYYLWKITSDCGRSLSLWTAWVFSATLFFAFLYSMCELDYGRYPTPFSPVYYSLVTLTTLGYGDVVPASPAAQFLAALEAICGYVGLGGLLSILSNKMARRAE